MEPRRSLVFAAAAALFVTTGSRAACEPAPDKLAAFLEDWRAVGARLAARPWMEKREILVLADKDVEPALPREAVATLSAQLAAFGAGGSLRVNPQPQTLPAGPAGCVKDGVLDERRFAEELERLRAASPAHGGRVLVVITNAAIGIKPQQLPDGSRSGPPAGSASHENGWILLSDFWHYWNRENIPGFETPANRGYKKRFEAHSRDHTLRHELGHLLGLPHHERIENPGFPEPKLCTECGHFGAGAHKSAPHRECVMTCGSGDDDWSHVDKGRGSFGFCPKCLAAARASAEGLAAGAPGKKGLAPLPPGAWER
jgi:hypothetical protein